MQNRLARVAALSIILIALATTGCATKTIISQWTNPSYTSPRLQKIMVIAVTDKAAIRRNFEDALASKLRAVGVDAVSSYRYIPEDGKVPEERLSKAVREAGADAVILSRLLRVEHRTDVIPGYYEPYPRLGMYGWYSSAWYGGFYTPPRVYGYPVYFSETTMYSVPKDDIVWTGTLRTIDPENVDEAIHDYVDTVVAALQANNVLRG